MTLQEQYNTADSALAQCMIHHATAIMTPWAKEIGYEQYAARLEELEDNYKPLVEWFLVEDNEEDREHQLNRLTGKAYVLLDELFAKVCAKRGISFVPEPDWDDMIEAIEPEANTAKSVQAYANLIIHLILRDNRIDFFPDVQKRVEEVFGDGTVAFATVCGIVESSALMKQLFGAMGSTELNDRVIDELPDTWLFDILIGDDEERLKRLAKVYLEVGRLDLLWDNLEEADRWLVKRGDYYYLNQGGHKGESIESMLRIDRSYLEWIVDKCKWTDDQTRGIIGPYIGRYTSPFAPAASAATPLTPSRGKKRSKGTITDADLSLF